MCFGAETNAIVHAERSVCQVRTPPAFAFSLPDSHPSQVFYQVARCSQSNEPVRVRLKLPLAAQL